MAAAETGVELQWTPTQADFDLFAELSGDDNPIHVDADFSARTRFGRTVSHGMLLYARLWAMIADRHPGRRARTQTLMFPAPSFAGEPLTLAIRAKPDEADTLTMTVTRTGDGEITLAGECRLGLPDETSPAGGDPPSLAAAAPGEIRGLRLGQSATTRRAFRAADMDRFAGLAGLARRTGDGVPEPLIGALFSYLLGVRVPGFGTNYLKQEMHFAGPAPLDVPLEARVEITRIRPDKDLVDLATTCRLPDGPAICHGRALVLVKDVGKTIGALR